MLLNNSRDIFDSEEEKGDNSDGGKDDNKSTEENNDEKSKKEAQKPAATDDPTKSPSILPAARTPTRSRTGKKAPRKRIWTSPEKNVTLQVRKTIINNSIECMHCMPGVRT